MLFREIITFCCENHMKHVNTLCGQNAEFSNVQAHGIYSNHWAINAYVHAQTCALEIYLVRSDLINSMTTIVM
jgi:hypothetical protein